MNENLLYDKVIEKYRMVVVTQNGQEAIKAFGKPTATEVAEIRANKQGIIARIKAQETEKKAVYEAREARIRAIEGLAEIQKAIDAEQSYRRAFDRMMEDAHNDGALPPEKPTANSTELKKQYPRAAAYIKAEGWSCANNYARAVAGRKALERIINGEDHIVALADMKAEWDKAVNDGMWN